MLEVGKLYVCEQHHLMLYPDPETASAAAVTAAATDLARAPSADATARSASTAATYAAFWSNHLRKPVFYTEKNIPFLVLNNEEEYIEVLAGDRKGWIMYEGSLNIKEIDYV